MEDELAELRRQIAERDAEIESLENMIAESKIETIEDESIRIDEVIKKIIQDLCDEVPPSDIQKLTQLQNILSEQDLAATAESLIQYVRSTCESKKLMLTKHINGHIEFLTRLVTSPELQSLFLIEDRSGHIFLPETIGRMLVSQASRTTELAKCISDISINERFRMSGIEKLVNGEEISGADLELLIIQEMAITYVFRKYMTMLPEHQSRVVDETADSPDIWSQWARRLFYGLERRHSSSYEEIQAVIAEAALTSAFSIND